jgi:hypothetical protein
LKFPSVVQKLRVELQVPAHWHHLDLTYRHDIDAILVLANCEADELSKATRAGATRLLLARERREELLECSCLAPVLFIASPQQPLRNRARGYARSSIDCRVAGCRAAQVHAGRRRIYALKDNRRLCGTYFIGPDACVQQLQSFRKSQKRHACSAQCPRFRSVCESRHAPSSQHAARNLEKRYDWDSLLPTKRIEDACKRSDAGERSRPF